jgi:hypothetical protein
VRPTLALGALAVTLASTGCGGVQAADLFIVQRSGSTPQARLTLLVNEEGVVHCNGGPPLRLSDPQIVKARDIQEELHGPASKHLSLPAQPGSVLSYYVRDVDGTARFSDNSPGQPAVLRQLALFVLQTSQQLCHLPQ